MKSTLEFLTRKDLIIFRDNLIKHLYDINTDDPKVIIHEVYRLLTDLSDKVDK